MAKTVFGMPGLGNKLPGDVKKPGGSADGQAGGSPSQQSTPSGAKGTKNAKTDAKGPAMAKPVKAGNASANRSL